MKTRRQAKILEFINEYSIETQEELLDKLREDGFNVTQATVSRDIKELRLHKSLSSDGRYCYTSMKNVANDVRTNFSGFFKNSVTSIVSAQNIIIIKTLPGMAQAVCASLDNSGYSEILGTIAGDDTIFVVCPTTDTTQTLISKLKNLT